MPPEPGVIIPARTDPLIRPVLARWRRLTGGSSVRDEARRTLVACSGGADSSALLLALASVSPPPVAAHVVHDLRPADQAEHDFERTAALCGAIGVELVRGAAEVAAASGNAEANARRAREAALAAIARDRGLPFVATGHHADDQLETVLMRVARGTGVRGLRGIAPMRGLGEGVRLVRPMLDLGRADTRRICARAGWRWAEDETNRDLSRARAAIRERVLPVMLDLFPHASRRSVALGAAAGEALDAVETWVDVLMSDEERSEDPPLDFDKIVLPRGPLRAAPSAVLRALIERCHRRIVGVRGRDRLSERVVAPCVAAIRLRSNEPKTFEMGGLSAQIDRGCVVFHKSRTS